MRLETCINTQEKRLVTGSVSVRPCGQCMEHLPFHVYPPSAETVMTQGKSQNAAQDSIELQRILTKSDMK